MRLFINRNQVVEVFNEKSDQGNDTIEKSWTLKSVLKKAIPLFYIDTENRENKAEINDKNSKDFRRTFSLNLKDPKTLLSIQMPFLTYDEQTVATGNINRGEDMKRDVPLVDEKEGEAQDIYEVDSEGEIIFKNKNEQNDYNIDNTRKELPDLKLDGEGPEILIYHTHTTEAYRSTSQNKYKETDPFRTTDQVYNVTRVGRELALHLENDYNIDVVHATDIHDYPVYNYSYNRSLKTIEKQREKYKQLKIFFDIHRNAYKNKPNDSEIDCINISGKKAAKIMIVVGSDKAGLSHPNWKENYAFALLLKDKLNKIYPGLCSKVLVKTYRYNQHISQNALLLEIGSTETTLEEAIESTKYLAKAIADTVKSE